MRSAAGVGAVALTWCTHCIPGRPGARLPPSPPLPRCSEPPASYPQWPVHYLIGAYARAAGEGGVAVELVAVRAPPLPSSSPVERLLLR